ncbi:MAG: NACHT domain-containing protein [Leptolyngbyaceae cyanobacterium CSU_1_3]|nr:NACHT domain-containing protein [Leptolyngbyaceae cyanobacterium CSU_1_3]
MIGLERVVIQAASLTLASIFSRVLYEGGGKLLVWMNKNLGDTADRIIAQASEKYVQNYSDRHGILKVLGMREPVPLESVYTMVKFLDRSEIRRFESIESLEAAYRQSQGRSFQPQNSIRRNGLQVANEKQFLMVLGSPGAGKSTFIRKIGLEALKGEHGDYEHECIPVLLELKSFNGNEIDIEKAIAQEFKICGLPCPEESTTKLLEAGKLLILLDGLDEVPSKNLNEAIHQIQNFVDQYDKNRFIASCRIAAYQNYFRRFTDVAMADFDPLQIRQFISNWFYSQADRELGTALKCWSLMQKPENAAAKELAQTPLLLTLLCLVYDRSQNFPQNRSVLYRKALRVLLEEWASEKRILQEEIYEGLNTELEEILLSEIAYTGFVNDRLFFSQREIVSQIKSFLTDNLNAPRHLNGEAILNEIAIQQGILVERAEDVFSFSHLTLQEYLTAQYIDDQRLTLELVTQHLKDERWREVFLLVAGITRGGADELLLAIEAEAKTYIDTPKLRSLLQWAHTITDGSSGTLSPCVKRTTAIFMALIADRALDLARVLHPGLSRTLDLARTLARARVPEFAHTLPQTSARAATPTRAFARAMTQALADELEKLKIFCNVNFTVLMARLEAVKAKMPDIRQPADVHQAFQNQISHTWLTALQLNPALVSLSESELQSLEHYLYAHCLMVQCKQSAVRVSPKTWEAIEARMLLV